ncbi:(3,5-dihydroxyphenyl)acetyl-CoA 1,2-dioxygenase DpgC [Thermopolyspora sp. NPDC052614]|uniref:(3,5-dihydroxyphenyl)acetyl-CoA 1,2-dioxygenase DpgC n=1 Tax=Thermopolyspora sp. NPDC052614 TaxID=3155682 RepID=UPI00342EBFB8
MTASSLTRPADVSGDLTADTALLREQAERGEDVLASLPPKPARTPTQRAEAERVHRELRWLRSRFMAAHAPAVYSGLTDGRTLPLRLDELVTAAAEAHPGLVPSPAQLAAESGLAPADREGREIDQGVFFRGILRDPVAGGHLMESMLRPTPRALDLLDDFRRTGALDLGSVRIVRDGTTAALTIHNEHCLNAEDNKLTEDLETAVDLTLLDESVRVGTLRGAPMTHPRYAGRRVFSAGINLKHLHRGQISYTRFLLGRELGYIHKIFRGLLLPDTPDAWPHRLLAKPFAAAVDTFAIGGGMQLLFVFDKVIAGSDAYFSLPAAQEGIVPGVGNLRLTRAAGGRLSRQVILGGRRLWATEPDAAVICDEVVDPAAVGAALDRAADALTADAVAANRVMLNLAEEPWDDFRAYMAQFALVQALRLYSEDVLSKVGRFTARSEAAS